MQEFLADSATLVWPAALAFAWVFGEVAYRGIGMPRIGSYVVVGFLLGHAQIGLLPRPDEGAVLLVANMALGLMLFEFGHRINLRWLRVNPWMAATGLVEMSATFIAVYLAAQAFGSGPLTSALLGSLALATSPVEVLRVINEQRSSGQVTERALHLSAFNCIVSVVVFNAVVGFWAFRSSGSLAHATSNSLVVLGVSVLLGAVFAAAVPELLRWLGQMEETATPGYALAVMVLTAVAHLLKVSPLLAALMFGVMVRHRRVTLNPAQRNFGALGDLTCLVLYVFVGSALAWNRVLSGAGLAAAIVALRFVAKSAGVLLFAHFSGTSWRKGFLASVALSPMSALAMGLLVQTRYMGINLMDQLAPLAGATLFLGILGPVLVHLALVRAGEGPEGQDR